MKDLIENVNCVKKVTVLRNCKCFRSEVPSAADLSDYFKDIRETREFKFLKTDENLAFSKFAFTNLNHNLRPNLKIVEKYVKEIKKTAGYMSETESKIYTDYILEVLNFHYSFILRDKRYKCECKSRNR